MTVFTGHHLPCAHVHDHLHVHPMVQSDEQKYRWNNQHQAGTGPKRPLIDVELANGVFDAIVLKPIGSETHRCTSLVVLGFA